MGSPAEAGFDDAALCRVLTQTANSNLNIHSVLIERHGKLISELYRAGPEPTEVHDLRSITKSVTGLLAGIAQERGQLPPLEAMVVDQFSELHAVCSGAAKRVSINDVLTMSTGLEWKEWGEGPLSSDETGLLFETEQLRYVLNRKAVAEPGTQFNYNGGNTAALAQLIARGTGRRVDEFVREALFEPLHIQSWEWSTDGEGRPLANCGLRLRPRDTLKLGRLMNNRGRWGEVQVVPETWVADSIKPHIATGTDLFALGDAPVFYGRQWWVGKVTVHGVEHAWAQGVGNGGQRVFIIPALELTIVLTAGDYGSRAIQQEENAVLMQLLETFTDGP